MSILVVENQAKTTKFLQRGLGEAGFVIDVAEDGADGLHLAQELRFNLIILDVMLSQYGWLAGPDSFATGGRELTRASTQRS